MMCLTRGVYQGVMVQPRWPSSKILIDPVAFERLQGVQAELAGDVSLILTRAFEPRASGLGWLRNCSRQLGIALFKLLYPKRRDELADIFGSNGHDVDGTHVDVSLAVQGRRLRFLPLSVFTPIAWQQRRMQQYLPFLVAATTALQRHGFQIHRNATESLQIHCDLRRTELPETPAAHTDQSWIPDPSAAVISRHRHANQSE